METKAVKTMTKDVHPLLETIFISVLYSLTMED
jgi:hypothetical protein